ncbi:hypothetical protein QBC35DRAFT_503805 [Podospora australis]|uniref:NAD-dependent epimerase/dehydratase domain-containing protein n=1 Tax=Podospora australis TaxID=1536484 RepID=A0AAN6WPJ9_9PEZI|nr:hypothetical protein QBC35DRAFT_503805 [Podospora australis]
MATPSRVFITGVTGFIGSQVLLDTLEAGHHVRFSVRREAQIDEVKARYPQHVSQLEAVVIPSIESVDALRPALSDDINYVLHIASPMPGKGEDFKTEYLKPAVDGTEAMLNAAKSAPTVKRVVIMSSLLSLMPLGAMAMEGLHVRPGENANIAVDPDTPFPDGPAGYGIKYSASKILAHRATIQWVEQHKPHFSVVTVHPTFVLGRDLTQRDAASPNGLNAYLLKSLTNPPGGNPVVPASMVDVRDVSQVVLRSLGVDLNKEELVTEYLVDGNPTSYDEVVAFVKRKYPEIDVKLEGPFKRPFTSDTSRTEKELGIQWHGMEEIVSRVLDQQSELGERVKAEL